MEIGKDPTLTKKIGISGKGFGGAKTPLEKMGEAIENVVPGGSKTPGLLQVLIEGQSKPEPIKQEEKK